MTHVIGLGCVGSHLSLLLAGRVPGPLHVYDGDMIEQRNAENQLYPRETFGQSKTDALSDLLVFLREVMPTAHGEHVTTESARGLAGTVILCVDSHAARRAIFRGINRVAVTSLYDVRIGAHDWRIYHISPCVSAQRERYEATLQERPIALDEHAACGRLITALPRAISACALVLGSLLGPALPCGEYIGGVDSSTGRPWQIEEVWS